MYFSGHFLSGKKIRVKPLYSNCGKTFINEKRFACISHRKEGILFRDPEVGKDALESIF